MATIVESGALYLAVQLTYVVLLALEHPVDAIIAVVACQIYVSHFFHELGGVGRKRGECGAAGRLADDARAYAYPIGNRADAYPHSRHARAFCGDHSSWRSNTDGVGDGCRRRHHDGEQDRCDYRYWGQLWGGEQYESIPSRYRLCGAKAIR